MRKIPFLSNQVFIIIISVLALYAAVVASMAAFGIGHTKLAYVVNNEIMEKYTGAVEAQAKFDEEAKVWENNIQTLQTELDSLGFLMMKDAEKWGAAKRKKMTASAQKKHEDLQRYSQAIQKKAAARRQELLGPVIEEINVKIAEFGKSKGYTMILGTTDGNIVYAQDAVNVTEEVVEMLNAE